MGGLIDPAARLYAAVMGLLVLFHVAVSLGAPFGQVTLGGRWPGRVPWPARGLSVLAAGVGLWTATVWIGASGIGPAAPSVWQEWVAFGIMGVCFAATAVSPSVPERRLWAPVTAVLLVAASLVLFRP